LVACFATYEYIDPVNDKVYVQNNYCQGTDGHGFAFPHIQCSELQTHTLGNNTAGSCDIGFIFTKVDGNCQAFSWISAYACQIGQISGAPNTIALQYSNFIMADNQRGATLKFGNGEGDGNHTAYLYNSYISAISRPNCVECYANSATYCSGNIGLRMLSASANG